MRIPLPALIALLLMTTSALDEAAPQKPAPTNAKPPKTLTLVGCVVPDLNRPGAFTLSDTDQGIQYRLTGTSVRDYAGRRVRVSGPTPKHLRIVGGLYPSPNIAAQGGSIDPTRAAMAAMEPPAAGPVLTEFSVKSVREVAGTCPRE